MLGSALLAVMLLKLPLLLLLLLFVMVVLQFCVAAAMPFSNWLWCAGRGG